MYVTKSLTRSARRASVLYIIPSCTVRTEHLTLNQKAGQLSEILVDPARLLSQPWQIILLYKYIIPDGALY